MGGGDYMYGAITSSPFDSPFPTPSPSPVSLFDLETLGFLIIKTIPPKITQAQKNNTNKQLNKIFKKKKVVLRKVIDKVGIGIERE